MIDEISVLEGDTDGVCAASEAEGELELTLSKTVEERLDGLLIDGVIKLESVSNAAETVDEGVLVLEDELLVIEILELVKVGVVDTLVELISFVEDPIKEVVMSGVELGVGKSEFKPTTLELV